ncbi:MAG TPA: hypothetical protein VII33_16475, partial [Nakamurella sp.]
MTGADVRAFLALALALVLLTGCDSALDGPGPQTATAAVTSSAATTVSITPVTPDGMITGPGVTDEAITLGLLVDPGRDRGFSDGVRLWQQTVNSSGGLCGRTVQLATAGVAMVPAGLAQAYDSVGRSTLGLITLPEPAEAVALNSRIVADQIPALTPAGSSAQLGPGRPIVVGPTDDVLAINGLDYLAQTDRLAQGATVGVLTDGSATADNALAGARWWADRHQITLDVRTATDQQNAPAGWDPATAVLALTDAATTARLAAAVPSTVTILTTVDGYDPTTWGQDALAAATAGRVLVTTATPAFSSDYPAAVAVASRAASVGGITPGPRL